MSSEALRVLGLGIGKGENLESNLTFIGILGNDRSSTNGSKGRNCSL